MKSLPDTTAELALGESRPLANPKNGEVIHTPLTDQQAADVLYQKMKSATGRSLDFMENLLTAFERQASGRREMSPAMNFWLHKIALDQPKERETVAVNLSGVLSLLTNAKDSGLKHPKINLRLPDSEEPLRLSLAGQRSKTPGWVQVTDGGPFGSNKWYGRVSPEGKFEMSSSATPAVVDYLQTFTTDPAKVASEHGHATGCCCFCNRELTDEKSTSVGYGPVCAERFGLAWG